MKPLAYTLISLAVIGSGFALLTGIVTFFVIPIELADRLIFGMAWLVISAVLALMARRLFKHFFA
jgi:uncharacterized membrane protein YvlD (DUF360 family)